MSEPRRLRPYVQYGGDPYEGDPDVKDFRPHPRAVEPESTDVAPPEVDVPPAEALEPSPPMEGDGGTPNEPEKRKNSSKNGSSTDDSPISSTKIPRNDGD
jgi:hypothetical protein